MNMSRSYLLAVLLLLLALALTRDWMQSHMARHMLLQMPALAVAGWGLHQVGGAALHRHLAPWNRYGLTGLLLIQCMVAFWMVPRALDLALSSSGVELAKYTSWVFTGAMLRQSMLQSHVIAQMFMLGDITLMTAAVSDIYAASPNRLCNYYGLGDQVVTAQGMWMLLTIVGLAWALQAYRMNALPSGKRRTVDVRIKPESTS
jgi:hypothetical protein